MGMDGINCKITVKNDMNIVFIKTFFRKRNTSKKCQGLIKERLRYGFYVDHKYKST